MKVQTYVTWRLPVSKSTVQSLLHLAKNTVLCIRPIMCFWLIFCCFYAFHLCTFLKADDTGPRSLAACSRPWTSLPSPSPPSRKGFSHGGLTLPFFLLLFLTVSHGGLTLIPLQHTHAQTSRRETNSCEWSQFNTWLRFRLPMTSFPLFPHHFRLQSILH